MSPRRRVWLTLAAALAFGIVAALAKGTGPNQVRGELGNLSAPWVMIALLAGCTTRSRKIAALLGVASTTLALTGFCCAVSATSDLGDHGTIGDLELVLRSNGYYFLFGLLSGPVFGALGAWCARRSAWWIALLASALLALEPMALRLDQVVRPPVPVLGQWAAGDATVYAGEAAFGVLCLLVTGLVWWTRSHGRRLGA